MNKDEIINEYFEWMYDLIYSNIRNKRMSHRKLLMQLFDTEFIYSIPQDINRAEDGIDLRYRFGMEMNYPDISEYLDKPCSVLEMIIALAVRCEEHIMDDPDIGNRTGQWFLEMITNLGLRYMTDSRYDRKYVSEKITTFLNRDYEPNGKGGLFIIENCDHDLRNVEIWYQMCWYLNTVLWGSKI